MLGRTGQERRRSGEDVYPRRRKREIRKRKGKEKERRMAGGQVARRGCGQEIGMIRSYTPRRHEPRVPEENSWSYLAVFQAYSFILPPGKKEVVTSSRGCPRVEAVILINN